MFDKDLMYCCNCKKYYNQKTTRCLKCKKDLIKKKCKMSVMTNVCFACFVLVLILDVFSIISSLIDLNNTKAEGLPFLALIVVGFCFLIYYFIIFFASRYSDMSFRRGSQRFLKYLLSVSLIIPPFVYFENKIRDRNLPDVIFDLIQFIIVVSIVLLLVLIIYYLFIKKDSNSKSK